MEARGLGKLLVLAGIAGLVLSIGMDTSVSTGLGRVNNLGLMKDQQNYLMISLAIIVVGTILLLRRHPERTAGDHPPAYESVATKTCPECAEQIMLDAKVCRFCGNRVFPEPVEAPYEPTQYIPRSRGKTVFERLFWSSADPDHPGNRK